MNMSDLNIDFPSNDEIAERLHQELKTGLNRGGGERIRAAVEIQELETRQLLGKIVNQHGVEQAVEFVSDLIAYGAAYTGEAFPPVEQLHQALTVFRERGLERDTGPFLEQVSVDSRAYQYKTVSRDPHTNQRVQMDHLVAPDDMRDPHGNVVTADPPTPDQAYADFISQQYQDAQTLGDTEAVNVYTGVMNSKGIPIPGSPVPAGSGEQAGSE